MCNITLIFFITFQELNVCHGCRKQLLNKDEYKNIFNEDSIIKSSDNDDDEKWSLTLISGIELIIGQKVQLGNIFFFLKQFIIWDCFFNYICVLYFNQRADKTRGQFSKKLVQLVFPKYRSFFKF